MLRLETRYDVNDEGFSVEACSLMENAASQTPTLIKLKEGKSNEPSIEQESVNHDDDVHLGDAAVYSKGEQTTSTGSDDDIPNVHSSDTDDGGARVQPKQLGFDFIEIEYT